MEEELNTSAYLNVEKEKCATRVHEVGVKCFKNVCMRCPMMCWGCVCHSCLGKLKESPEQRRERFRTECINKGQLQIVKIETKVLLYKPVSICRLIISNIGPFQ